jgi:hypothetical protein
MTETGDTLPFSIDSTDVSMLQSLQGAQDETAELIVAHATEVATAHAERGQHGQDVGGRAAALHAEDRHFHQTVFNARNDAQEVHGGQAHAHNQIAARSGRASTRILPRHGRAGLLAAGFAELARFHHRPMLPPQPNFSLFASCPSPQRAADAGNKGLLSAPCPSMKRSSAATALAQVAFA